MSFRLFESREDAGLRLAGQLAALPLKDPLVLAIPRGGIDVAAPIARALGAELDVVLSRKLRSPDQPELALGAVSESGEVYLGNHAGIHPREYGGDYIAREHAHQMAEIARRASLFREVRPPALVAGRSVVLVDDGIATGSTMIAALKTIRARNPLELIVAVPVAPQDRIDEVGALADRVVCPLVPDVFWAVGEFYRHFPPVSDERVVAVLRAFNPRDGGARASAA